MSDISNVHHVFTKSIAGFHIYRTEYEFQRMIQAIRYYQYSPLPMSFSNFKEIPIVKEQGFNSAIFNLSTSRNWPKRIEVLAYCLMNTHLHIIIKEIQPGSLSKYMADLLNSYTRYFNNCYQRKGPLWQNRFGRFSLVGEENLLRTAVYVHLNPVNSYLTQQPEEWPYSSYTELIKTSESTTNFCTLQNYLNMHIEDYCAHTCAQIKSLRAKAAS